MESSVQSNAAAISSFSAGKRSLSDPEIHFTIPIPFGGQPIILTVNHSSDKNGKQVILYDKKLFDYNKNIIFGFLIYFIHFIILTYFSYRKCRGYFRKTAKQ